jgi:hypothetical protein
MMVHNKTGYGVNFHQFLLICATIGTPPPPSPLDNRMWIRRLC